MGLLPRTVPSKVPYVQDILTEKNQLFIFLTESWLREQKDAELKINGYTLYRADCQRPRKRRGRDSGGVAIYVRQDVAADMEPVLVYSNGVVEVLGLFSKSRNILLIGLYRHPDNPTNRSTCREFKMALAEIEKILSMQGNPSPDTILCGDFNLPKAAWPEGIPDVGCSSDEKEMIRALAELTNEFFLSQKILTSTHRKGNTLDLVFTNNPLFLHSYNCTDTMYSDHSFVECSTTYGCDRSKSEEGPVQSDSFDRLNFFNEDVDWNSLDDELRNYNWSAEFRALTPEKMLDKFLQVCLSIAKDYVPLKARAKKQGNTSKIPRDRRNLMRRRRRVNTQMRKTTSEARRKKLKLQARDIEKKLQDSYRQSRKFGEDKAVGAIKHNSKYFFSYARKFSSVKASVGPLIDAVSNIVTCPMKMAEMLAEQYSKVFSEPREPMLEPEELFPNHINPSSPWLHDIRFDVDDIVTAIDEIPRTAAAGPDKFPVLLLKNCKYALAGPLHMIWRKSMDAGEIPTFLKTANIVPIHKGGNRGESANYRPVALTSHIIKLFEKVIRKHIVAYMEENNLFNPSQHGFRSGRSCLSQLIAHHDYITKLLEQGHSVDVVYLDFAKAFDKVDHLVTMKKLKDLGISGKLGRWIHAFLTDRKQSVVVEGRKGHPKTVKSGVPQGSVLGPLLFLVLIGDIDQGVASAYVSSFADDTRVAHGVNTTQDIANLQTDLDAVYKWADDNNMQFNSKKFECLRYGTNAELRNSSEYLSDTGDTIKEVDYTRDLGVTMSSDGSFRKHITNVVTSANLMCGWILRTFITRNRIPMLTLWKSLVRSRIDYCCQLWYPTKTGDIQTIEQVQRSFIRKITGMHGLSYWEQLSELSLYSLERRRERYIILYVWRILENLTPNFNDPEKGGIKVKWNERRGRVCDVPSVSRQAPAAVQRARYSSFAIIGPKLFNSLPREVRNISGCEIDVFKRKLDKYLKTVPDEPLVVGYTMYRRAESNSLTVMTQFAPAQQVVLDEPEIAPLAGGGHPRTPRK